MNWSQTCKILIVAFVWLIAFECTPVAAQGLSYYGVWFQGGYFRYSKSSDAYVSMSDTGGAGWDTVAINAAGYNGQMQLVSSDFGGAPFTLWAGSNLLATVAPGQTTLPRSAFAGGSTSVDLKLAPGFDELGLVVWSVDFISTGSVTNTAQVNTVHVIGGAQSQDAQSSQNSAGSTADHATSSSPSLGQSSSTPTPNRASSYTLISTDSSAFLTGSLAATPDNVQASSAARGSTGPNVSAEGSSSIKHGTIIGATVAAVVLLGLCLSCFLVRRRRKAGRAPLLTAYINDPTSSPLRATSYPRVDDQIKPTTQMNERARLPIVNTQPSGSSAGLIVPVANAETVAQYDDAPPSYWSPQSRLRNLPPIYDPSNPNP